MSKLVASPCHLLVIAVFNWNCLCHAKPVQCCEAVVLWLWLYRWPLHAASLVQAISLMWVTRLACCNAHWWQPFSNLLCCPCFPCTSWWHVQLYTDEAHSCHFRIYFVWSLDVCATPCSCIAHTQWHLLACTPTMLIDSGLLLIEFQHARQCSLTLVCVRSTTGHDATSDTLICRWQSSQGQCWSGRSLRPRAPSASTCSIVS